MRKHLVDVPFVRHSRPVSFRMARSAVCRPGPVAGLLADRDIRLQAEQRAAPVGAAPGRRLVHAAFAGAGQTQRHGVPVFRPNIGDVAIAGLCPRDAFDVGGQAFRQPIVPAPEFGQREVHHFVHQHPVVRQGSSAVASRPTRT